MQLKTGNWLNAYMKYTAGTEVPARYNYIVGLWAIAAALGRKVAIKFGREFCYPNLYAVLCGPAAVKKTTAIYNAYGLLEQVDGVCLGPHKSTKEALYDELLESSADVNINGVNVPMSSLSLGLSEFTNFIGYKDAPFLDTLNAIFDGKDFVERTRSRGKKVVPNCCLNLVGATTPNHLSEYLPTVAIGGGFSSRILIVYTDDLPPKVAFPEMTAEQEALRPLLIEDLNTIHRTIGEVTFEPEAKKHYIEWYEKRNKVPEDVDDKLVSYYDRKFLHLLKLATLMCIAEGKVTLNIKALEQALTFLNEVEVDMPKAYGSHGANKSAALMDKIIKYMNRKKTFTFKDIQTRFWREGSTAELVSCVEAVDKMGLLLKNIRGSEVHYAYAVGKGPGNGSGTGAGKGDHDKAAVISGQANDTLDAGAQDLGEGRAETPIHVKAGAED